MVEGPACGLVPVPQGRVASGGEILFRRLAHRAKVEVGLRGRIAATKEPVGLGRTGRLGGQEVVDRQIEARSEAEDRGVTGIDQLAAELADLVLLPMANVAVHAPADPQGGGLVDGDVSGHALVLERQRRREAGDARADDGDAWRRGCGGKYPK